MFETSFPVVILNPDFSIQISAKKATGSGAMLIIAFHTMEGYRLSSAVLLPVRTTDRPLCYESDMTLYPIFFPNGDMEIKFGYHIDTFERKTTPLAFITTRSQSGEMLTRVHGLQIP